MSKKVILPTAIILVGVLTLSILVVAKPKPMPKPEAEAPSNVKVKVVKAVQQSVKLSVTTQGTVTPKRQIDLVSQVSGQIVSVSPDFVSGGFFAQSEVLIQIDDRDYKVALLAAKAQLAEAERRLAEEHGLSRQAKREWRDLGNQSANDLFVRKPQLAAAKANLASAQASVELAELNLERTQIKVPFAGRIKQIYADLGKFVVAGASLATVYDSSTVEIRLPLTEKQAGLIDLPFAPRQAKAGAASLPPVTLKGSVAGEVQQWQGVLARTDAFVDSNSRMYFAVVEVAKPFAVSESNSTAPLLPGLFVEAEIQGKTMNQVIVLPREALYQRDKILTLDQSNTVLIQNAKVLKKSKSQVWVQANIPNNALIPIEKQSLIPVGTIVDPIKE